MWSTPRVVGMRAEAARWSLAAASKKGEYVLRVVEVEAVAAAAEEEEEASGLSVFRTLASSWTYWVSGSTCQSRKEIGHRQGRRNEHRWRWRRY